jgi:hypothetical protein
VVEPEATPACNKQEACCCKGAVPAIDKKTVGKLVAADREMLTTQMHDEHLAHDLYVSFFDKWELRPFSNISQAETHHLAMVNALADAFELEKPDGTKTGVFADAKVQKLYNRLHKQGQATVEGALKASAYVEEMDLTQIRLVIKTTENPHIKSTFEMLNMASQNHLRAFVRNLAVREVTYKPQILSEKDYAEILLAEGGCSGSCAQGACGKAAADEKACGKCTAAGNGQGQGAGNGPGKGKGFGRGAGQGQGHGWTR